MDDRPRIAPPVDYDELGPLSLAVPERRLWGAVVIRAVLDYTSPTTDHHVRRSARRFLFSDNPRVTDLRLMAALFTPDPEGFVRKLRQGLEDGTINPLRVVLPD